MNKKLGFLSLMVLSLQGEEMIQVRKSEERGLGTYEWLTARYTFSFADFYDEHFMGFRKLRVINEDIVAPKKGFDTHPHNDMEILTYIIEGTLEHKDTLGNSSQIKKGEFQLQCAGTGIEHSEFNPSHKESVHLLQIWIQPEKKGLKPNYQQRSFADHQNGLQLVASPKNGPLTIHQDVSIYLGRLEKGTQTQFELREGRYVWIQMVKGKVSCNGTIIETGDGMSLSDITDILLQADQSSEFLLFDLK